MTSSPLCKRDSHNDGSTSSTTLALAPGHCPATHRHGPRHWLPTLAPEYNENIYISYLTNTVHCYLPLIVHHCLPLSPTLTHSFRTLTSMRMVFGGRSGGEMIDLSLPARVFLSPLYTELRDWLPNPVQFSY